MRLDVGLLLRQIGVTLIDRDTDRVEQKVLQPPQRAVRSFWIPSCPQRGLPREMPDQSMKTPQRQPADTMIVVPPPVAVVDPVPALTAGEQRAFLSGEPHQPRSVTVRSRRSAPSWRDTANSWTCRATERGACHGEPPPSRRSTWPRRRDNPPMMTDYRFTLKPDQTIDQPCIGGLRSQWRRCCEWSPRV